MNEERRPGLKLNVLRLFKWRYCRALADTEWRMRTCFTRLNIALSGWNSVTTHCVI